MKKRWRQTDFFSTNENDNLKQKLLDDIGEWGTILDNYTGDGVLGAVAERRADIGVGAFYLWYLQIQSKIILWSKINLLTITSLMNVQFFFRRHHEFLFLDFSAPISRSGVTNLCPKPRWIVDQKKCQKCWNTTCLDLSISWACDLHMRNFYFEIILMFLQYWMIFDWTPNALNISLYSFQSTKWIVTANRTIFINNVDCKHDCIFWSFCRFNDSSKN